MTHGVRIAAVAVAHPDETIVQADVPRLMDVKGLNALRARAVVRGSRIKERRIVLHPDGIRELKSIEQRNAIYQERAPGLALAAIEHVLGDQAREVGALVTTSCTGYMVPSLATHLVERASLCPDTARLPITEAGCAGGVVALAHAANYLAAHPGRAAIACAVELCSLSFHHSEDEGVLTANLIFGDGAGAALLRAGPGEGIEIVDSASVLIPGTRELLGFNLTDEGFMPVLSRRLADALPDGVLSGLAPLLSRHGLRCSDIGAWLLHPGGSRILSRLESTLHLDKAATQWSWASLRDFGNTSSAAIFDVLRRYLESPRPMEWGVVAAFGPGVAVELLLVRRAC